MVEYAPGMRTIIRDEEWMVKKIETNYRTTEEIRRYAFALLNGISFDDLDGVRVATMHRVKGLEFQ